MQHFRFAVPTLRDVESFQNRTRSVSALSKQQPRQSAFSLPVSSTGDLDSSLNLSQRLNRLPGDAAARIGSVFPDGLDSREYRPARTVASSLQDPSGGEWLSGVLSATYRRTQKQIWSDVAASITRAVQRNG